MAKTCDICGAPLKLLKFRYAEGLICRDCYDKVTAGTRTIVRQMTRSEIEEAIRQRQDFFDGLQDFRATLRVGDVLLVDQERKLFCLPHNRRIADGRTSPEIIPWDEVCRVRLVSDPAYTFDELRSLSKTDPDAVVTHLCIEIYRTHQTEPSRQTETSKQEEPSKLCLFTTPVRAKSFAYRQSLALALRAMELLEQVAQPSR